VARLKTRSPEDQSPVTTASEVHALACRCIGLCFLAGVCLSHWLGTIRGVENERMFTAWQPSITPGAKPTTLALKVPAASRPSTWLWWG